MEEKYNPFKKHFLFFLTLVLFPTFGGLYMMYTGKAISFSRTIRSLGTSSTHVINGQGFFGFGLLLILFLLYFRFIHKWK